MRLSAEYEWSEPNTAVLYTKRTQTPYPWVDREIESEKNECI